MITIETISPTHHTVKHHERGETQVLAEVYTNYEFARLIRYAPNLLGAAFKTLSAFTADEDNTEKVDPETARQALDELHSACSLIIDRDISRRDAEEMIRAAEEAAKKGQ